jgi:hypothetical protein
MVALMLDNTVGARKRDEVSRAVCGAAASKVARISKPEGSN